MIPCIKRDEIEHFAKRNAVKVHASMKSKLHRGSVSSAKKQSRQKSPSKPKEKNGFEINLL